MIRSPVAWFAFTAAWLVTLTAGVALVARYESTPGAAADPLKTWPAASELGPPAGRPTILLFAHPHCPCTRAGLENLAWVLDRAPANVRTIVVLVRPPGADAGWEQTALAEVVARLPRVELRPDPDGLEAQRFGAKTSGQTFLFDGAGQLVFRGGLTAGRGVTGPSVGRAALLAHLTEDASAVPETAVFGCPLFTPSPACAEGCPACQN